jgi:hypothetical protein
MKQENRSMNSVALEATVSVFYSHIDNTRINKVGKLQKNESGFSVVEIVLALVLVVIIVVVGWIVINNHNTAKDSSNQANLTSAAGANPTSSWSTQCAASIGLCVKYPSTWKVSLLTDTSFTIGSPDNTAFVQVGEIGSIPSYTEEYHVTTQSHLYAGDSLKVIGGYTVGATNNSPSYAVVLAGFGDPNGLKVGTQESVLVTQYFEYLHSGSGVNASAKLLPQNGVPTNATPQESTTWLNSATAQTGLEILKSLTAN